MLPVMEILVCVLAVQVLNLLAFAWLDRTALVRVLVLRQQLAVYKRKAKRPRLRNRDRLFWSLLSRIWDDWASELIVVKPATVIRWRKRKFREYWWRKFRRRSGRPTIPREHVDFIRRISSDHPEYGEDRIALDLEIKSGIRHSPTTIRKYMVKGRPGPRDSQAWRTVLRNQAGGIWTCDVFVQHTIRSKVLYVFVIMELVSRKIVHFNVTAHPTLEWTRGQGRVCPVGRRSMSGSGE